MAHVGLEHLTKTYPGPGGGMVGALKDFSLSIADRELCVVVGPSGSGKTTLLRIIAGLEQPDQGQIVLDGQVINRQPPRERDIAMVFQSPALYPHLTVYENMAFGLRLRGVPRPEIERRVRDLAERLGLVGCLERKPMALSGGERQRVALGRALVRRPKVLLLDEPFSNLDPQTRVRLRGELLRLHRDLAATFIYVTHDQGEAMTLATRLAVIESGTLKQAGEPRHVYRKPENLFVAGFIGSPGMNFFEGRLLQEAGRLFFQWETSAGLSVPAPVRWMPGPASAASLNGRVGQKLVCGIRPEHVRFRAAGTEPGTDGTLSAAVEQVERQPRETLLQLRCGEARVVACCPVECPIQPGHQLVVWPDSERLHFFDPATEQVLWSPEVDPGAQRG